MSSLAVERAAPPHSDGVPRFLGLVQAIEAQLGSAFRLVAERHTRDPEIADMARLVADWSSRHEAWLGASVERYGIAPDGHPGRLASALLEPRSRPTALLEDLRDLDVLAVDAEMTWTILVQGAKELGDAALAEVAADAREHIRRIRRWLRTAVSHEAPESLAVAVAP